MAVTAMWQNQYALSIRKGPIDLSKTTTGGVLHDAASHTNTGVPTIQTDTGAFGGDQHFLTTVDPSTTAGTVIGQHIAESVTMRIFGLPVVGSPDFTTGQEFIEVDRADGFATPRSDGVPSSNLGSNDIFRAGQNPTTSFDCIATNKALVVMGAVFFQHGIKEVTGTLAQKSMNFPTSSDGSDPLYYGTFLRKISTSGADSRLLSDGIGTAFRLKASQTEPLTVGLDMTGRILVSDANCSDIGGSGTTHAADFTIFSGANYLLQNCVCTMYDGTTHTVLPITDININCTSTPSYARYNTFFPVNIVMGNYSMEGSITIPASAKGGGLIDANKIQKLFTEAGSSTASPSPYVSPRQLCFFWGDATSSAWTIGQAVATGSMPVAPTVVGNLFVRCNVVVTDVSMGGDNEAMTTVNFRGFNTFTPSTGAILRHAIQITTLDDLTTTWGFTAATTTFEAYQ